MQDEVWKDISEFCGFYQVSNFGRVRRIADYSNQNSEWNLYEPKILTPRLHTNGYLRVMLSVSGKHYDRYIHRLVAAAFIDNENGYSEVNHIDGNKQNNNVLNLEWCTRSQNNRHAYRTGLKTVKGCYGTKKKVAQLTVEENRIIAIYGSIDSAAQYMKCRHCMITNCCSGRYKTSKGYKWIYATDDMKVGDVID